MTKTKQVKPLVAILMGEADADRMVNAIAADSTRLIGTPTLVEAAAVMLARKGSGGEIALDALLQRLDIRVIPMSEAAAKLARVAYAEFGKGVGSPAVLNFGDCLSYGVAMAAGEPLLCKGADFTRTGVDLVAY